MSSTVKSLALLAHFSPQRPEIGLSALCRLAGRDKATTYRHLQALEHAGFVEQNPLTKQYRLGPIVLQLAQTREQTVPRKAGAEPALFKLAQETEETAHVSVLSGTTMYSLASHESPRHSIRVKIDIGTFSLHATASGLIALAFGPSDLMATAQDDMTVYTPNTIADPQTLMACVEDIRLTGFARSNGSREHQVDSIAAPIFDHAGHFAGAVTVASVATRMTPASERVIYNALITASRDITHNWGGSIPETLALKWAQTLSDLQSTKAAQ